ncbi:putative hydrolase [Paraburkholderia caribensis MBA4]|uniref:Putative hydrolase n=1 Tax=Paraburkholderia caribensis MBA4 TaxID=1323664 RepID=A0A0P0RGB3_9BURK|nr:alpha/beta hydrolase [Paraburkholderia caribensis]ALL67694.1 putative hydrolase [Paraburkholderia caribensis MBA4]
MTHDLNAMRPEMAARLIFDAFKKPSRPALRPADEPLMARAQRSALDVDGHHVVVYEWGHGNRLAVCVHGWSARASDFCAFIEPLVEAGYRVVAFDNLGHGESGGETATLLDVHTILTALQQRKGPAELVIAHSLGVLYAFYALNHGVHASHLVALSGVCDFSYLIARYTASLSLRPETIESLKRQLEAMFGKPTIWTEFSADHNLDRLSARVTLIHDADDEFVELSQSEKLLTVLGNLADLHVSRGLGHRRILNDQAVIAHALNKIRTMQLR